MTIEISNAVEWVMHTSWSDSSSFLFNTQISESSDFDIIPVSSRLSRANLIEHVSFSSLSLIGMIFLKMD